MNKLFVIIAAMSIMPSMALADPGECDSATSSTRTPRCFNVTPGNPFYNQSNQGAATGSVSGQANPALSQAGVTGSTRSQPASVDRAPAARRQARYKPSNQQAVSSSMSRQSAAGGRMPAARQSRYQPPSQGDITGSIGSPPAGFGQAPGARRQTYSDGRPSSQ